MGQRTGGPACQGAHLDTLARFTWPGGQRAFWPADRRPAAVFLTEYRTLFNRLAASFDRSTGVLSSLLARLLLTGALEDSVTRSFNCAALEHYFI